ncbi:hypothetical protein D051_1992 [Vibrio parahaemolyticus VPCR-2010]|nr:hypothetical protein D051_1992 [Vibrio parahaemolyticus VPCR-2010]
MAILLLTFWLTGVSYLSEQVYSRNAKTQLTSIKLITNKRQLSLMNSMPN